MKKILSGVMKIGGAALDVLSPPQCAGCGKEGKYVCDNCQIFISENALICPICQKASPFGERHLHCHERHGLDGLTSIWDYDGVVKNILHKIKYDGVFHAVKEIIERAFGTMANDETRFKDFLSFADLNNTCLTYVPIHKKKENRRMFNQSEKIANEMGKYFNLETIKLLEKIRETESQTKLTIKERLENVKESFDLKFGLEEMPKNIILVDDIWTTGATMKECCKVLKKAGAEKVWGFTMARTV